MSDKNNDQELEKTTDATADEVTSETETNDAIESVPADSVQFSVTFDDVDDESTVDDGIYSALASAETGATDETSEAEADAIASANASAEVTERNAARVNETLRLAKTDHKDALAEHAEPQGKATDPTMTLASRIDRVLVGGGSDDILLKTYPTFATLHTMGPKNAPAFIKGLYEVYATLFPYLVCGACGGADWTVTGWYDINKPYVTCNNCGRESIATIAT